MEAADLRPELLPAAGDAVHRSTSPIRLPRAAPAVESHMTTVADASGEKGGVAVENGLGNGVVGRIEAAEKDGSEEGIGRRRLKRRTRDGLARDEVDSYG
jgi:hypothetical protein